MGNINITMAGSSTQNGPPMREKDTIDVPQFPSLMNLPTYKVELQTQLSTASTYSDDAEIEWVSQAWAPDVKMLDLSDVELRYRSLRRKLAT